MLKVYKQETYEGCLPVSLMILGNIKSTKEKELEIILNGVQKPRDNSYSLNMITSFIEKYNTRANLYVNNKFYTNYLTKQNQNNNINIIHHRINLQLFLKLKKPFTLYVDDFILGEEAHSQHFIIVEKIEKNLATIIDPWPGIRKVIKTETLLKASKNMWNQFLYCPLLITLEENKNE